MNIRLSSRELRVGEILSVESPVMSFNTAQAAHLPKKKNLPLLPWLVFFSGNRAALTGHIVHNL